MQWSVYYPTVRRTEVHLLIMPNMLVT